MHVIATAADPTKVYCPTCWEYKNPWTASVAIEVGPADDGLTCYQCGDELFTITI